MNERGGRQSVISVRHENGMAERCSRYRRSEPRSSRVGASTIRNRSQGGVIASRLFGSEKNANTSSRGRGTTCVRASEKSRRTATAYDMRRFLPRAAAGTDTDMAITTTTGGLDAHGLDPRGRVYWQPTTSLLYTHALALQGVRLAEGGALVVDTGRHTGRSPKDRFLVREPVSEERVWWGDVNKPIEEESFEGLRAKLIAHLDAGDVYVVNAFAGADPAYRIGVRVITDSPWHALFAKTLFIEPSEEELAEHEPDAVVLHAPSVEADPAEDGTRTGTFVVLHPSRSEILIGGTEYAGEIKKSIFTLMNDRLPLEGVLPMHCSANVGDDGRVAVFFGLSGTGKTTLSADPERHLIGDDEHGWSDEGIFNLEGGCYAKVIRLSPEAEPQI